MRKVKLGDNNYQCPSNFYDSAWDQPGQTFEDAVRTHRGPNGFRGEKNGAACLHRRVSASDGNVFLVLRPVVTRFGKRSPRLLYPTLSLQ
jgi:hypothetical protein